MSRGAAGNHAAAAATPTETMNRSLEALRGFAALLVVGSHSRLYPYLLHRRPVSGVSGVERLLLVPTSFGREAVAIFFVLSGYLVGGQVSRQVRQRRFDPRVFVVKRLSRFWVVLLPGLALTAVLDLAGLAAGGSVLRELHTDSFATATCNAVFLMDGRCPVYGSNESLWSLGYEFWFYVVFAGAVVGAFAVARGQARTAVTAAAVAVAGVALYGLHLLWLIPAWLMGVVVADVQPRVRDALRRRYGRAMVVGVFTLALGGLLASTLLATGLPLKYAFLGVCFAPLVLVMAEFDPEPLRVLAPVERLGVWLGTWSFSLYVFHLPVLVLVAELSRSVTATVNPLTVYVTTILVTALVYPCYWLGEAHTATLRTALLNLLPARATRRTT